MTDPDEHDADDRGPDARAADQLCEATEAIRDVDLNLLLDDDVRTVLDAKAALLEICLRHRQNQQASERYREPRADEP